MPRRYALIRSGKGENGPLLHLMREQPSPGAQRVPAAGGVRPTICSSRDMTAE